MCDGGGSVGGTLWGSVGSEECADVANGCSGVGGIGGLDEYCSMRLASSLLSLVYQSFPKFTWVVQYAFYVTLSGILFRLLRVLFIGFVLISGRKLPNYILFRLQ